jgi:hypothetical protein
MPGTRPSFPSLSGVDLTEEQAPPERVTSKYSIISERSNTTRRK